VEAKKICHRIFIIFCVVYFVCSSLFIGATLARDSYYRSQYNELENNNKRLTESLDNRGREIQDLNELARSLREQLERTRVLAKEYERDLRERQAIIKTAGELVASSESSLDRLKSVIEAIKRLE